LPPKDGFSGPFSINYILRMVSLSTIQALRHIIVIAVCIMMFGHVRGCPFEQLGHQASEARHIHDLGEFNKRIGELLVNRQLYPDAVLCYEWLSKQLKEAKNKEFSHLSAAVDNNIKVLRGFMPTTKSQLFEEDDNQEIDVFGANQKNFGLKWRMGTVTNNISRVFQDLLETKCPFKYLGFPDRAVADPISVSNVAAVKLIAEGKLLAALGCFKWAFAITEYEGRQRRLDFGHLLASLQANVDSIDNMLSALPSNHVRRRLIHISNGTTYQSEAIPVRPRKSNFIKYWDGVMNSAQCAAVIRLFESSKLYEGNIIRDGKVVVDAGGKKNSEFDITGTVDSKEWATLEVALLSLTTKYLLKYEELNPVVHSLPSPLGDEGFRMKRYKNDGTEHHSYHIDSGSELSCKPRRVLAMILYLNEVFEGGETVFLNHGKKVKPKCGRIVFFPTDYTIIHAGRRPVSNTKYNIINFLTY
jgi:hypothetical protein